MNRINHTLTHVTIALAATFSAGASSAATATATAQQSQAPQSPQPTRSSEAAYTEGEVRKVDKRAGKITVKHAEIKSLDMPAMTMVFGVKDSAMLDQVKAGDKIRFSAANDGGKFTLTEIQPSK